MSLLLLQRGSNRRRFDGRQVVWSGLLGAAGWGLRGNPAWRFYFLEGLGNDGKTTLFNALLETLGDYAAPPMSNSMFNGGRNGERPDAPMAYLKTFQEVPLVFIAEPPKELARTVSGSDTTNTSTQSTWFWDLFKKGAN